MSIHVLGLYGLFFCLAFGGRTLLQLRRTGSTGFNGLRGRIGSLEWTAGLLLVASLAAGVAAPILDATRVLGPMRVLDGPLCRSAGVLVFVVGLVGTLWAQLAMGSSWRIGVATEERTALVTKGPFRIVRNPIYSASMLAALGLGLCVPNAVACAAWIGLVIAIELQVRVVEEPYLSRTHGLAYVEYAARVGRFVPFLGRLAGQQTWRAA